MANPCDLRLTIVPSPDDDRERDVDAILAAFEENGIKFSREWTPTNAPEVFVWSFMTWWGFWWSWWRMLGFGERDLTDFFSGRPVAVDIRRAPMGTWPLPIYTGTVGQAPMALDTLHEVVVILVPTAGPVLGTILGAWLQGRYGRKVRVKSGDVEVEAQTPQQVEALLSRLSQLQERKPAKYLEASPVDAPHALSASMSD
jgi:hypothetical protein